jgi:hypothetical protein
LYHVKSRPGTNVNIFVPGHIPTRYKCEEGTFVPVGATNRYKCLTFVLGGLEETPTRPVRGHLHRSIPLTGTNVVICTGGTNTRYK